VRKITLPVFDPDYDPLEARRRKEGEERGVGEERENGANAKKRKVDGEAEEDKKETRFVTGVPLTSMAGHTGYLTFATLPASH